MSAAIEAMRSAVSRRRSRIGESASIASGRGRWPRALPAFPAAGRAAFATVRLNRPASVKGQFVAGAPGGDEIVSYSIFIRVW